MFVRLYVEIIHELELVDYLHVQADNPWYNYYINEKRISTYWEDQHIWVHILGGNISVSRHNLSRHYTGEHRHPVNLPSQSYEDNILASLSLK